MLRFTHACALDTGPNIYVSTLIHTHVQSKQLSFNVLADAVGVVGEREQGLIDQTLIMSSAAVVLPLLKVCMYTCAGLSCSTCQLYRIVLYCIVCSYRTVTLNHLSLSTRQVATDTVLSAPRTTPLSKLDVTLSAVCADGALRALVNSCVCDFDAACSIASVCTLGFVRCVLCAVCCCVLYSVVLWRALCVLSCCLR